MKKAIIATAVGALALGAAVPAFGQEKSLGFSIRAGIFTPTDQSVKDVNGTWIGFGADYRVYREDNFSLQLSVDYSGKNSERIVPLTMNVRARDHQFYAFAGAGIGFARDLGNNFTTFAYEGGLGWDFNPGPGGLFLEAKYIGSSVQNVNGIGVYLGVRF